MKKRRLVIYIIILLLLLICICIASVAIIVKNSYKSNNVIFEVNSEKAYSQIQAKYFHNNVEDTDKAYNEAYLEGYDYTIKGTKEYPAWNIGDSVFTVDYKGEGPETLRYEIYITNMNSQYDLIVALSDVAVGEKVVGQEKEIYFYTTISYQLNSEQEVIMFSNKDGQEVNYNLYQGNQRVSIADDGVIPCTENNTNSSLKITIEIERKTNVKAFDIANNFRLSLFTDNDNQ